jgi:putative membrane protein
MTMNLMISLQGLDDFLAYFVAALAAEAVFVLVYMRATPHHEMNLIKAGNVAAAVSLGGAVLGFTLPLASAVANSVSLLDMGVWAVIALIVQTPPICW